MWKFLKSASDLKSHLNHDKNEICFIGKSNVGKSSLINALANNKKLAKTSKTPGRTQLINYFETENNLIVVDLPGYGFANISYSQQEKMFNMIEEYFQTTKPTYVFLLIDSRRGISSQDEEIINHLIELKHQIIFVLTKIDKAKQSEISKTIKHKIFSEFKYFLFSINNQKTVIQLKEFIDQIN